MIIERPAHLRAQVTVREATDSDAADWQRFVFAHPRATFFHRFEWRALIAEQWRHKPHFLIARRGDEIVCLLPLALMKTRLVGTALVSLPFKVLLFVMVDGWYLLTRSLVMSFQ